MGKGLAVLSGSNNEEWRNVGVRLRLEMFDTIASRIYCEPLHRNLHAPNRESSSHLYFIGGNSARCRLHYRQPAADHSCAHTYGYSNTHNHLRDPGTKSYPHYYARSYPYCYPCPNVHCRADSLFHSNGNSHTSPDADCHAYSHEKPHANADSDSNPHPHPDT